MSIRNEILQRILDASIVKKGVVTLDFGTGSSMLSVAVTGIAGIKSSNVVTASVAIEETANHSVDELLVDPIRVHSHDIVEGVGFTITGLMDDGTPHGVYKINWVLS